MRIKEGSKAINFSIKDYKDQEIVFERFNGLKVLLSFFRGASCPFCNLRVNQLIKRYTEFQNMNIDIVTFFAATQDEISRYAGNQNAPFPIIPDPLLEIYKKYGVESSKSGMLKVMLKPISMLRVMTSGFFNMKSISDKPLIPADFLIDENQIVYRAYYGRDFGDHINIDEILKWKK